MRRERNEVRTSRLGAIGLRSNNSDDSVGGLSQVPVSRHCDLLGVPSYVHIAIFL